MKAITAIILLLIVASVLTGISAVAQTVNVETVDPVAKPFWVGIVYVFQTSAVAPLFVLIRNIYGYFKKKEGAHGAGFEYEVNQLKTTWITIEGYTKGLTIFFIAATVGTTLAPYAALLGGAAAFVVDLVRSSLSDLSGQGF